MKISKIKGLFTTALIVVTFFSLDLTSLSSYQGRLTFTEIHSEKLASHGDKETKVVKDFSFNITKNRIDSLNMVKKGSIK